MKLDSKHVESRAEWTLGIGGKRKKMAGNTFEQMAWKNLRGICNNHVHIQSCGYSIMGNYGGNMFLKGLSFSTDLVSCFCESTQDPLCL